MSWNWQQTQWPNFDYDAAALVAAERQSLINSGEFIDAYRPHRSIGLTVLAAAPKVTALPVAMSLPDSKSVVTPPWFLSWIRLNKRGQHGIATTAY